MRSSKLSWWGGSEQRMCGMKNIVMPVGGALFPSDRGNQLLSEEY